MSQQIRYVNTFFKMGHSLSILERNIWYTDDEKKKRTCFILLNVGSEMSENKICSWDMIEIWTFYGKIKLKLISIRNFTDNWAGGSKTLYFQHQQWAICTWVTCTTTRL